MLPRPTQATASVGLGHDNTQQIAQLRPCTWSCKCTGCCNPTRFPPPEKVSPSELTNLPLEEIVAKLTHRDIEYFASRHGRFLHYATMIKLCDPCEAASCLAP